MQRELTKGDLIGEVWKGGEFLNISYFSIIAPWESEIFTQRSREVMVVHVKIWYSGKGRNYRKSSTRKNKNPNLEKKKEKKKKKNYNFDVCLPRKVDLAW